MALTPEELLSVRAEVGTGPTDLQLDALHDVLGSPEAVAQHVITTRLTDLRSRPARTEWVGDTTEDWGDNIKALERQVADLASRTGTSDVPTGQLVRRRRR